MTGLMSVVFTEFVDQKSQLTCWHLSNLAYIDNPPENYEIVQN